MKKTLLTIFTAVLAVGFANGQCTPDPKYLNQNGNFFPTGDQFKAEFPAIKGTAYSGVVNIKTITDTVVNFQGSEITATIDAFRVLGATGLPTGFSWQGGGTTYEKPDPTNYGDPGTGVFWNKYATANNPATLSAVQGCVEISANVASVNSASPATGYTDYPIVFEIDARIVKTVPDVSFILPNGTWLSETNLVETIPLEDYVVRVSAEPLGVSELLNLNDFNVAQSYPNPASDFTTISFTTPSSTKVELRVYNMLGGLVYAENINSQKGMNNVELSTSAMTSGLYVYTVSNGEKTYTKRMTVK
ncbi:T9SS type A sorting domain-containing protein [Bacteroidota bacterium]